MESISSRDHWFEPNHEVIAFKGRDLESKSGRRVQIPIFKDLETVHKYKRKKWHF